MRPAERRSLLITGVAATLVCGLIAVTQSGTGDEPASAAGVDAGPAIDAAPTDSTGEALTTDTAAADPASAGTAVTGTDAVDATGVTAPAAAGGGLVDGADPGLDGEELAAGEECVLTTTSVRQGETGESVICLQEALITAGYLTGAATGTFDAATFAAVERMQGERNLYVDGVVGRESALSLGIWPDEASFVTRTPPPPAGAVDLLGYPLSSVATSGPDAPPLPPNSGSGKRVVYSRSGQRVWAVDSDERIIRSWLVAGSQYSNEIPGTHEVYSRSEVSTAWNGKAWLPKMIRWLDTERGAIGFHAIPLHVEDDSPYMTESELGQRLSGGCQRQANRDADFLWDFAPVGTKVVVL